MKEKLIRIQKIMNQIVNIPNISGTISLDLSDLKIDKTYLILENLEVPKGYELEDNSIFSDDLEITLIF